MELEQLKKLFNFAAAEIKTEGANVVVKLPFMKLDTDGDGKAVANAYLTLELDKGEAIDEVLQKVVAGGLPQFLKDLIAKQLGMA